MIIWMIVCFGILYQTFYLLVKHYNIGLQPIREDGPAHHHRKEVFTMGGVLFVLAALVQAIFSGFHPLLQAMVGYGILGLYDDFAKVYYQDTYKGLSPKKKFICQWLLAFWLVWQVPYDGYVNVFGLQVYIGLLYPLFSAFVVVASSNAYNLMDGVDGLAVTQGLLLLSGFWLYIVQYGDVSIITMTTFLWAAMFAFFCFNVHPAKMFMGDVGALSVGATLGLLSVILKIEFLFAVISLVMVFETISVFIQVIGYKLGYGRFFKMAPFHHHLELSGWTENQIVRWAACITCSLIMICAYVLRY